MPLYKLRKPDTRALHAVKAVTWGQADPVALYTWGTVHDML